MRNSSSPRTGSTRRRRQGMILMVVMILLALFTLVAVTFVVATAQGRRGAIAAGKSEVVGDSPEAEIKEACIQLIRGTNNPLSVIGPHSLLEDMYGNNGRRGVVGLIQPLANDQLIQFTAVLFPLVLPPASNQAPDPARSNGYFVGRVLTMVDGPAAGRSTRVVGYNIDLTVNPPTITLRVASFEGDAPAPGNEFIINGKEFSGPGFGLDPATFGNTGQLSFFDAGPDGGWGVAGTDDDGDGYIDNLGERGFAGSDDVTPVARPIALLPNPTGLDYQDYLSGPDRIVGLNPSSGVYIVDDFVHANEDYDAPDFQNMLLAGRLTTPNGKVMPLPSLHRPDLCWYWSNRPQWLDPNFQRKVVLRPLPAQHPNFTGSNPSPGGFNAILGDRDLNGVLSTNPAFVWDVDNDGDGRRDSVWTDFGMPVQTTPDGRTYKRLFAVMVLDADSKLNLNAHGNYAHTDRQLRTNQPIQTPLPNGNGGATTGVALPIGEGYGPAEINPTAIRVPPNGPFLPPAVLPVEMLNLMAGNGAGVEGRYGEAYLQATGRLPMPGETFSGQGPDGAWGTAGIDDDLNGVVDDVSERGWPATDDVVLMSTGDDNYPISIVSLAPFVAGPPPIDQFLGNQYFLGPFGPFGAPHNVNGVGTMALGLGGNPLFFGMGQTTAAADDYYELNLSRNGRRSRGGGGGIAKMDNPFTPGDMELLARANDVDASALPSRLRQLVPGLLLNTNQDSFRRDLLTTESNDVPTPGVSPTPEIRQGLGVYYNNSSQGGVRTYDVNLIDMLRGKMQAIYPAYTPDQIDALVNVAINAQYITPTNRQELLAPDLILGLRFDVNRPFGNESDDIDPNTGQRNGITDEPTEAFNPLTGIRADQGLWQGSVVSGGGPVPTDMNNDGFIDPRDTLARQRYAKHLYVLMMLLTPDNALTNYAQPPEAIEALPHNQRRLLSVRRIAQWSVNAADFRDRDSIMTPFEFDLNPFRNDDGSADGSTWDVDGDLTTNEGAFRGVVWGAEAPALLITETMALHDRRVVDRDRDNNDGAPGDNDTQDSRMNGQADNDYDQERIPQGTALVELYCPRNPNNSLYSADLYSIDPNTNLPYLDLGRMAPVSPVDGFQYPVWRLAVSPRSANVQAPNQPLDPYAQVNSILAAKPDSASLELDDMDLLTPGAQPLIPERYVWLAAQVPNVAPVDANKTFYNRAPLGNSVWLAPGNYAVVGPYRRPQTAQHLNVTKIGFTAAGLTPPQEIHLGDNPAPWSNGGYVQFFLTDNTGGANPYPVPNNPIQPPLGIVVASELPASWNAINPWLGSPGIGFSISEPLFSATVATQGYAYYPRPANDPADPTNITDDHGMQTLDKYKDAALQPLVYDTPFDSTRLLATEGAQMLRTGTTRNYKTVFLQRLADPTQPYHVTLNPYRTVDWMPFDLTVFNGDARPTAANPDPEDPTPGNPNPVRFATRQRGTLVTNQALVNPPRIANGAGVGGYFDLWQPISLDPPPTTPPAAAVANNFGHNLDHSLGYLNLTYQEPIGLVTPWWDNSQGNNYVGAPRHPFPWLTWNDRPYVSQLELMLVPASSPSRLLYEFSPQLNLDPFNNARQVGAAPTNKPSAPFGHLLNFFFSYDPADVTNAAEPSSHFHRLFEYIEVPSRFSGTETLLDPRVFQGNAGGPPVDLYPFYAPFNRLSRYRSPGRMNINTIFDDGTTWQSLSDAFPFLYGGAYPSFWNSVWHSRKGYGNYGNLNGNADMFEFAPVNPNTGLPESPTFLANPFRSFSSSYQVPVPALAYRNVDPTGTRRKSVESGLLRPEPSYTAPQRPLFDYGSNNEYNNTGWNSYFHYQGLEKLGNQVTTRSNVYMIWITVGYFEVQRVPVDPNHPDGYMLGGELGIETGDVKRHRGFYIYDRSIPVGFQRGENLNVEHGLILERYIE